MKVYAAAARRFYAPPQGPPGIWNELAPLLHFFEEETTIRNVAEHVTSLYTVLESWSGAHRMTVSRWDFGYAAVRATARHPAGGMAVIEALAESPPHVETLVFHWMDDHSLGARRSWRTRIPRQSPSSTELLRVFDDAVVALLAPPHPAAYSSTILEVDSGADSDKDYWASFQTLH